MYELYDIRNFGAIGDGKTDNTNALKAAVAACQKAGGGTVVVSEGTYLFYPIVLYSYVHLRIDAGATLLAGTNPALYPEIERSDYWNVGFALDV
jgi:polygalacturonase